MPNQLTDADKVLRNDTGLAIVSALTALRGDIRGGNENFTDEYNNTTTYSAGDLVIYENALYKALSSTTGNLPTNPTYWVLTTISQELALKQNELSVVTGSGTFSVPVHSDSVIRTKKWGAVFFANVQIQPTNNITVYETELANMGSLCPTQLARYTARGNLGTVARLEIKNGKLYNESNLNAGEWYTIAPVII